MPLSDSEIKKLCLGQERLIEPFTEAVRNNGVISYGLSEVGYDLRLDGSDVWVFNPSYGEVIDPKRMADPSYREKVFTRRTAAPHEAIIVPANGYVLAKSYERFRMPNWLCGEVGGKSTYARCGVSINVTTLEPGWHGDLTIEIANNGGLPVKLYAMEGIAKVRFFRIDGVVERDYATKGGLYQGQVGVTAARVSN